MIEARSDSGSLLSWFAQSAANAVQTRRFQSSASARLRISVGATSLASMRARVTCPIRRYSVERGSSVRADAV